MYGFFEIFELEKEATLIALDRGGLINETDFLDYLR